MASILQDALEGRATIVPLTVEQDHAGIVSDVFDEDFTIELLDGLLVKKDRATTGAAVGTVGNRHRIVLQRLLSRASEADAYTAFFQSQQPISLPPNSEPEPDVSVVRGEINDYLDGPPTADDVTCVFEVADSSLKRDLGAKLRLYAASGITQYIVVDLLADRVLVHTEPMSTGIYFSVREFVRGSTFDARVGNGALSISVDQLLGR